METKTAWTKPTTNENLPKQNSTISNGNNKVSNIDMTTKTMNGGSNGHVAIPTPDYDTDLHHSRKITLSWENIDVNLPSPNCCAKLPCCRKEPKKTHILENVNGIAKPGELLAIMGASGAGKTTLLNVLNFRNRGDLKITGEVKINGKSISSSAALNAISGYVQQDEAFIGTLKVKEHLIFQAMLRMDSKSTKKDRYARIDEILNELNLQKCENTIIGNPAKNIKGISGGERRRLAFGSEIITNPGLLFCDEPTSGLDSFMALSVVESMRTLANEGKTIVCTIHQPSSEIFEMFDHLCLLAEGRLAYIGPSADALTFFSSLGFKCPSNYNPADFYIHKLALVQTNREECLANIQKVCDGFETSELNKRVMQSIDEVNKQQFNQSFDLENKKSQSPYKANFFQQMMWLLWRSFKSTARDVMATQIRIVQTIVIAVIFGLLYLQLKNDQSGIQNVNGVLFLLVTNNSFSVMFAVINSFTEEIPIFMREHKNGMYRVITYYLSKIIVDLPFFVILPIVSVAITYWMANLNNDVGRFFICCAIIVLVSNIAVAFGCFISAAAPSTTVALALSGPVLVPLMIFSGLFLNNSTVPDYFIWLKYLSWFSYSYELLNINQWANVTNITCTTAASRCLTTGDQVLTSLSMKTENYAVDFIALSCLLVGWRILTFFILLLKSYLSK